MKDNVNCYRVLRAELPGGERRDSGLRDDGPDGAVQPLRHTTRRRLQRRQDRRLGLSHEVRIITCSDISDHR